MKGKRFADNKDNKNKDKKKLNANKTKKEKKKKKNTTGRKIKIVILSVLQLVFLGLMIFSGTKIYNWYIENKKNSNQLNEISECVEDENGEFKIDFEALKQKNPDTVGWLKVENTLVEYPVVRTENNEFYLTHSFDKSYNSAGWAFMDFTNTNIEKDKNVVMYGHNRRDDSMFGTLKNILQPEWYNNSQNKYVTFITETGDYKYEVFSVYQIEKEDYYIQTEFNNNNEIEKFVNTIKSRSIKDFGVEVTKDDNILTLSTCANDNKYRIVLHAKRINE